MKHETYGEVRYEEAFALDKERILHAFNNEKMVEVTPEHMIKYEPCSPKEAKEEILKLYDQLAELAISFNIASNVQTLMLQDLGVSSEELYQKFILYRGVIESNDPLARGRSDKDTKRKGFTVVK